MNKLVIQNVEMKLNDVLIIAAISRVVVEEKFFNTLRVFCTLSPEHVGFVENFSPYDPPTVRIDHHHGYNTILNGAIIRRVQLLNELHNQYILTISYETHDNDLPL